MTGSGFVGASKVMFGTTAGTQLTVVSATQLRVTSPAHAAGAADVRVTTPSGTSAVNATDKFTYQTGPSISAVAPVSGPPGGGTVVTVTGSGTLAMRDRLPNSRIVALIRWAWAVPPGRQRIWWRTSPASQRPARGRAVPSGHRSGGRGGPGGRRAAARTPECGRIILVDTGDGQPTVCTAT